jgi:tetratricopeptide (TPR) repeat protein
VYINRGDKPASVEHIEKALQLAHRQSDESVLAFILFRSAYCYYTSGDFARCIALQLEQIELEHRLGNRSQEALGLGNLGDLYIMMGLYKQGRSLTEQARIINEAMDARRNLAYNLANLGCIYIATGDLRKARQLMEQALQEISPSRDDRGKVYSLLSLGSILLTMGDAPSATRRFIDARELALKHGMIALACEATTGLAASAIMQGQLEAARNYACEAWNYLKEHGWLGMDNPIRAYRGLTETFDSLGEAGITQAVLESGHQALVEVAATINVPEWRQSFLENVPDHRAIMEMWERRNL